MAFALTQELLIVHWLAEQGSLMGCCSGMAQLKAVRRR
jgi:hypothetical protein